MQITHRLQEAIQAKVSGKGSVQGKDDLTSCSLAQKTAEAWATIWSPTTGLPLYLLPAGSAMSHLKSRD